MVAKWVCMIFFRFIIASIFAVDTNHGSNAEITKREVWRPVHDLNRNMEHFEEMDREDEAIYSIQKLPLYETIDTAEPCFGSSSFLHVINVITEMVLDSSDDSFDKFQTLLRTEPKNALIGMAYFLNELDIAKVELCRVHAILLRTLAFAKVRIYEDYVLLQEPNFDLYKKFGRYTRANALEYYLMLLMDLSDLETLEGFLAVPVEVNLYVEGDYNQRSVSTFIGVDFKNDRATLIRFTGYAAARSIGKGDASLGERQAIYKIENQWLERQRQKADIICLPDQYLPQ